MHVIGTYDGTATAEDGSIVMLISVPKAELSEQLNKLTGEQVAIEIEKLYGKRSLNINSYCWVLCTKLAEALKTTKDAIYLREIRQYGSYQDIRVKKMGVPDLKLFFRLVEPFDEQFYHDYAEADDLVDVRCYIGSSHYDTKQMSKFVEGIKSDCELLGIDTWSSEEVAHLLSLWEGEKHGKQNT